jgi:hypothetical protein
LAASLFKVLYLLFFLKALIYIHNVCIGLHACRNGSCQKYLLNSRYLSKKFSATAQMPERAWGASFFDPKGLFCGLTRHFMTFIKAMNLRKLGFGVKHRGGARGVKRRFIKSEILDGPWIGLFNRGDFFLVIPIFAVVCRAEIGLDFSLDAE